MLVILLSAIPIHFVVFQQETLCFVIKEYSSSHSFCDIPYQRVVSKRMEEDLSMMVEWVGL